MNEQFTKTLDALDAAEKEMAELRDTLEAREIRMAAEWHEVETVARFRRELEKMTTSVQAMLAKRERAMLEKVRASV